MKILVIEDDPKIVQAITYAFKTGWPSVSIISTDWGQEGISMVESDQPDVIILDLRLPDINGMDVIKNIRKFSKIPILVLSANKEEITMVQALDLGANDYVIKPYRPLELIARIKRLVLSSLEYDEATTIIWGPFVLDVIKRELNVKCHKIELRNIECTILAELIKQSPAIVAYSRLANKIWGDNYPDAVDCLKVHIYNLRKKIEADPNNPKIIINKPGIGYFAVSPE